MVTARQRLTLEEFLGLPEGEPALEFEDGVVTRKVAPKGEHSVLQGTLFLFLERLLGPRKIARVFPELRTTYGGRSYVPDLAVYRWERVPRTATGRVASDFLLPPDVAIEIRSPRQSREALARRCHWYVEHGVQVALLVDDQDESIRVFRPNQAPTTGRGTDRIELDEIAPGLHLVAAELFAALRMD